MIRRGLAVLGGAVWLAILATPAGAQTAPTPGSGAVAVSVTDEVGPAIDEGVLARSSAATLAPAAAVYVGLSVLGATLGMVTTRRRSRKLRAIERTTGLAARRRDKAAFWDLPAEPSPARPVPARRTLVRARSGLPILVGSVDTVSVAEHRPTVRAGYAGGANDG